MRTHDKILLTCFCLSQCSISVLGSDDLAVLEKKVLEEAQKEMVDLEENIDKIQKEARLEAGDMKNLLSGQDPKPCDSKAPCAKTIIKNDIQDAREDLETEFLVCVSFSMSDQTLKSLHRGVSAIGGRLVVKGLIGDSIHTTYKKIKDLGIDMDINPNIFEDHKIQHVPTFLHINKKTNVVDRLQGNVTVDYVLEIFQKEGEVDVSALKSRLLGKTS